MGNPQHFSLELPQRCLQLIDALWPSVQNAKRQGQPELGPLTATFLISMSMPIITLPIERIQKQQNEDFRYADDRQLDPDLANSVLRALGGGPLRKAPFYSPDTWSFATFESEQPFNIAMPIPYEFAAELGSKQSVDRASRMEVSKWCGIIRNAVAHGGVAYLDEHGQTSYGQRVKMYAFVCRKLDKQRNPIGLDALRISQDDYRDFLRRWVEWLVSSGLASKLAA